MIMGLSDRLRTRIADLAKEIDEECGGFVKYIQSFSPSDEDFIEVIDRLNNPTEENVRWCSIFISDLNEGMKQLREDVVEHQKLVKELTDQLRGLGDNYEQ